MATAASATMGVATPPHEALGMTAKKAIAASGGALLTSLFVTPLDVAKVRLQAQLRVKATTVEGRLANGTNINVAEQCRCRGRRCPCNRAMTRPVEHIASRRGGIACMRISCSTAPVKLQSTSHALRHIFTTEGAAGLFAGLSPTLLLAVPSTVVYYVTYDRLLRDARARVPEYDMVLPLVAGSSARVLAASVTSPLELVRTRIQNDAGREGIVATFSKAIRTGGYASLLRGLGATLARDVPFSAVYWTAYESTQRVSMDMEWTRAQRALACGALSGAVAATVTTPFDVVKTLQQVDAANESASLPRILRDVVRARGLSAAFTGLSARVARVAPSCAIMITCYEVGKEHLGIE
jgi:solute carrier family 25, member 39/40